MNSYKRLVSGFEAPVHIAWSAKNRSPLIRIPTIRESGMRVELRSPDPAANPYLTLALCLAAGLDGIRNQIMPPENVQQNIFNMTEEEREALHLRKLPASLIDAIEAMEQDPFVTEVLGEHISSVYAEAKKKEWDSYCRSVSEWEVAEYLGKF